MEDKRATWVALQRLKILDLRSGIKYFYSWVLWCFLIDSNSQNKNWNLLITGHKMSSKCNSHSRTPVSCFHPQICQYRDVITSRRVAGVALIIPLMSCLHGSLIGEPPKRADPVQGCGGKSGLGSTNRPFETRNRRAELNIVKSSLKSHFWSICSSDSKRPISRTAPISGEWLSFITVSWAVVLAGVYG